MDIKSLLKASYKSQRDAQQELEGEGWTYDPDLSTIKNKVFLDPTGSPVVLHRGSKRIGEDWIQSNIPLAFGLEAYSPRFKESKKVISDVKAKYNKPVTSIGHSLGGSLAEKSGADKVITYQKGTGLGDITKQIPWNQTDIRTKYDLPSALSTYQTGGNKISLEGSILPVTTHSIDKGLPSGTLYY